VGNVNQELLPKMYKTANIFVTPSTSEVMPLSVLEGEACGLPVVALKGSGLDYIIENDKSGYILAPNPKLIAQKIIGLVGNKEKLKSFSGRSRNISKKYSLEQCVKGVLRLYKDAQTDHL
jgi:glycosyltransferase involved in cell wall biosynthesis